MSDHDPSTYRFGSFELDTASGMLRGPEGEVALRPKSMDLLAYLLRHAGRVVPKDELLGAVWAGVTVTEESLSQCIHDIRRAIGDAGQTLLRTMPRRGYMFVTEPPGTGPGGLALAKVSARIPVAIVPFAGLGGMAESDFFAAGMTEDIVTALSRIGELFVIAPSASYAPRGQAASLAEIAAELGTRYVLRGTVRIADGQLRADFKLGDGRTGQTVWAERFDTRTENVFAVQDEITRAVSVSIQSKLAYGSLATLWEGQTRDLRAWEKMVAARHQFLQFVPSANREAERLLLEALAIDPRYTGALIQLGLCYWWRARYVLSADKEQNLKQAASLAERALAVDPRLGSAHMLKGGIAFLRDRHAEALDWCESAVALAPSDSFAMAYLGLVCSYSRRAERGIETLKTAMRLSPQPLAWYYESLSTACLWAGRLEEAIAMAEENYRLQPEEPLAYVVLATAYGFAGRGADAKACIAKLHMAFPEYSLKDIRVSERYAFPEDLEKIVATLRAAGLAE